MSPITKSSGRAHAMKGGLVAGLIGGAVIAVFMLAVALVNGQDIWPGFKMAGAPFLGERSMQPGFDLGAVLVGVISHFAVSIIWGVLFAVLFYGFGKGATLALGALWGIVVWIGMFYVVLPLAGLGAMARGAPVGLTAIEHVVFGLAVALGFLPFQRVRPSRMVLRPAGT